MTHVTAVGYSCRSSPNYIIREKRGHMASLFRMDYNTLKKTDLNKLVGDRSLVEENIVAARSYPTAPETQ